MTPRGSLPYGEQGPHIVWEHSHTGRTRHTFNDEYLAMQFAVSISSQVQANTIDF